MIFMESLTRVLSKPPFVSVITSSNWLRFISLSLPLFFILLNSNTVNAADDKVLAADLVTDGQLIDLTTFHYQKLFEELREKHEYTSEEIETLFNGVKINQKVLRLMDKQWEAKPYYEYWPRFITASVIRQGKRSLTKFRPLFDRIEKKFGVNREVIVAIWAIESRFGKNTGGFALFESLNTLFAAYPRRSEFFGKELLNFLILCKENNIRAKSVKGSYAGAFGQAQFMPSSFNAYAVDFDGDGRRDLISSMPDVFASIANYLRNFGWILDAPVFTEIGSDLKSVELIKVYNKGRKGRIDWRYVAKTQDINLPRPPKDGQLSVVGVQLGPKQGLKMRYVAGYPNFHAITLYNHSHKYAMAVSELSDSFSH
jgi:membrane-bound lytic murein transglycosylase B